MKNAKYLPIATTCLVALLGIAHPTMGWSKSTEDTVKGWISDGAKTLKKEVEELGNDVNAIQDFLDQYHWKDVIDDKAISGPATLRQLELNEHSRAVVVKPGEKIEAEVKCLLDSEQCSMFGLYRIVVGIKGEGPQVVIANESWLSAGKSREKFTLIAPPKPGMYEIRFRCVDAFLEKTALNSWKDERGNEPDERSTIGIIFVK